MSQEHSACQFTEFRNQLICRTNSGKERIMTGKKLLKGMFLMAIGFSGLGFMKSTESSIQTGDNKVKNVPTERDGQHDFDLGMPRLDVRLLF